MAFASNIGGMPVIDDSNYLDLVTDPVIEGEQLTRGYETRDYDQNPFGSVPYAAPFRLPLIPRSEWADRIQEMEETESRLSDIHRYHKLPVLDQNGTNYCWINGVITAMHSARATANLPFVYLSPASGGAKIKNYRNHGGWGGQAIEFIGEHGVCDAGLWPPNAIDRRYDTPEARENAKKHRIFEFYELKPRSFDQLMTCLLLRMACPVAYNWWRHLVCALDPVVIEPGSYGIVILNSWKKNWGKEGMAVFREGKGTPDEAHAVRAVSSSRD